MEKNKYSKTKMLQFALIAAMLFGMYAFKYGISDADSKFIPMDQNEAKVTTNEKEKDAEFLVYVANVNIKEIKFGQLAQQKSTMTEIKELGKMMETAHSKCMNAVTILAKKKAIALPTVLNDNGNDAYGKLRTISVDR